MTCASRVESAIKPSHAHLIKDHGTNDDACGSPCEASGVCLHPWAALRVVGARLESAYQGAASESSATQSLVMVLKTSGVFTRK